MRDNRVSRLMDCEPCLLRWQIRVEKCEGVGLIKTLLAVQYLGRHFQPVHGDLNCLNNCFVLRHSLTHRISPIAPKASEATARASGNGCSAVSKAACTTTHSGLTNTFTA